MKIKWMIIVVAISSLLLSACATTGTGTKTGAIAGGVGGAVLGGVGCAQLSDNPLVIAACALLVGTGSAILVHKLWDEKDKKTAENFLNTSPSNGKAKSWTNPDTKNKFKMTALKASTNSNGQKCRKFKLVVNGEPPKNSQACRNKRGGWDFQDV